MSLASYREWPEWPELPPAPELHDDLPADGPEDALERGHRGREVAAFEPGEIGRVKAGFSEMLPWGGIYDNPAC